MLSCPSHLLPTEGHHISESFPATCEYSRGRPDPVPVPSLTPPRNRRAAFLQGAFAAMALWFSHVLTRSTTVLSPKLIPIDNLMYKRFPKSWWRKKIVYGRRNSLMVQEICRTLHP
ncbi:hypothetical protein Y032_0564g3537 [Ancylostoma ceylanicum]|uniref:Uncharacterized protein n=1 Tax=Ancylostoma ceylanicum TaxID=53326 RepID=A0A016WRF9_9BILA|nr:hypothetical protein Y032_0564g3537 [Ancylostoma ceylanicum]